MTGPRGWGSQLACVALLVATSLAPIEARAQGNDAALATELFNAGRDLMKDGNFTAACPKLTQSARLDAKVGTLARLAECEEKLGQMMSARAHWQQATNLARVQRDDRLSHVEAELGRVDKVVPKLNVTLTGPTPAGLSLRIDGVDAGAASLGLAVPVDAGRHVILVTADGKKPFSTTVETKGDGAVTPVNVPGLEDAPPAVAIAPLPSPALASQPGADGGSGIPSGFWTTPRKVGLGVASAGAATLVAGAVFGVLAKVKLDASNQDGCKAGTGSCSGAGVSERSTAFSDGTIGTVLLIAGGIVAASGLTVILVAPAGHEAPPRVSLTFGPEAVLAGGSF